MENFTPLEQERLAQGLPPWESMSFACGGWLQFYMYGVCKALQATELDKNVIYCGCSAGAIAATGIALEGDFDAGVKYCKEVCIPVAHGSLAGLFQLEVYVGGCIDECMTPHFTKEKANNLHMATTTFPNLKNKRFTSHETAADMKAALLASCAAFPAAKMVWIGDSWHIDGGITDFQPIIDANTITVSPFYFSDCDIKPSRYVPIWWAFLPPNRTDTCDWLYSLGFEDGMNYIKKREILKFINRKPIQLPKSLLSPEDIGQHHSAYTESAEDSNNNSSNNSVSRSNRLNRSISSNSITTPNRSTSGRFSPLSPTSRHKYNTRSSTKLRNTSSNNSNNYDDSGSDNEVSQLTNIDHTHDPHETLSNATATEITFSSQKAKKSTPGDTFKAFLKDISQVCSKARKALSPHPFDTPRTVSIHRFLGYDLDNMTHNYVSFTLDLFLLLLLILLWKPLALILIYIELLIRTAYLSTVVLLNLVGIDGYMLYKYRILKRHEQNSSSYHAKSVAVKLYDCLACILSVSLFLRFVSGRPSSVELRKHDRLAKHSLLYRIFRHII